ncbi:hypothetical protein [Puniceibacterium sp. IMCC21224]|uniref:hypothetical protein n=1 Tax=Puniceibacterium sp. IMCC21224 TaxID=1618204 RepID=UPI00065CEF9B|nr:hypothetical protein [Puniceibacterium sp. IMCC21224]KMK65550.1 hypothetical protein IMCC21224_11382 [Puniceibacterium sp. IMCC21224]
MPSDFDDMTVITALMQDRALASYRRTLEEEVSLRQELGEIEQLRIAALHRDSQDIARRVTGADGLWQGWIARRRTGLNQELAMLQIRKSAQRTLAQTAFARNQVAEELAKGDNTQKNRRREAMLDQRLRDACSGFTE